MVVIIFGESHTTFDLIVLSIHCMVLTDHPLQGLNLPSVLRPSFGSMDIGDSQSPFSDHQGFLPYCMLVVPSGKDEKKVRDGYATYIQIHS